MGAGRSITMAPGAASNPFNGLGSLAGLNAALGQINLNGTSAGLGAFFPFLELSPDPLFGFSSPLNPLALPPGLSASGLAPLALPPATSGISPLALPPPIFNNFQASSIAPLASLPNCLPPPSFNNFSNSGLAPLAILPGQFSGFNPFNSFNLPFNNGFNSCFGSGLGSLTNCGIGSLASCSIGPLANPAPFLQCLPPCNPPQNCFMPCHKVPVPVPQVVNVPFPVQVQVPVKCPVPVPVEIQVSVPCPFPVHVPVDRPVPVPVAVPVPVPCPVPVQVPCPIQVPVHIPIEVPVPMQQFAPQQQFSNFSPQQMLQNYQLQQNPPITPGNVPNVTNSFGTNTQYANNAQISPNAGQFGGQQGTQTNIQQPFSFQ